MAHSTADSIFASSKTISALFPPSSMQVGLPFTAAAAAIVRPVAVLPVKDILAMPVCSLRMHYFIEMLLVGLVLG